MAAIANPMPFPSSGDPIKTGNWSHGLCGCFDNLGICLVTYLVPCVTFGQVAEAHGDSCFLYGLLYLVPFLDCYLESQYRETIRERRGVHGSFIEDLILIMCCPLCTLTQEAMEIREIQAEEARIGAVQGGAPAGAFAHTTTAAGQPYLFNQQQPTYPPAMGVGAEPYYPPAHDTPDLPSPEMNRE